jgi:hypothetical protein
MSGSTESDWLVSWVWASDRPIYLASGKPYSDSMRATPMDRPGSVSGSNSIAKSGGAESANTYIRSRPDWQRETLSKICQLVIAIRPDIQLRVRGYVPVFRKGNGWIMATFAHEDGVRINFTPEQFDPSDDLLHAKSTGIRYWQIENGEEFPEERVERWIKQVLAGPGGKSCLPLLLP